MAPKTAQLQIRVSPEQKRTLKRLARDSGLDLSSWVLGRVLPHEGDRFRALTARLATTKERSYALAELADWLRALPRGVFERAVARPPASGLDAQTLNYLAGAIELAATRRGFSAPDWVDAVPAPPAPLFGSQLTAVRLHLLATAPVAMRRRNVFVDASVDQRV